MPARKTTKRELYNPDPRNAVDPSASPESPEPRSRLKARSGKALAALVQWLHLMNAYRARHAPRLMVRARRMHRRVEDFRRRYVPRARVWLGRQFRNLEAYRRRRVPSVADGIKRVPARARDYRVPLLSPALNVLLLCGVAVVSLLPAYGTPPAERYPVAKTLEIPAGRELVMLSAGGERFARRGGCVDAPVRVGEVPRHFTDALLAMEDRRFYYHFGVDPLAVARAAKANMDAGHIVEGGSTLTQQLAKNTYLSRARTYDRKFEEAIIALQLELALTKTQILERYLSSAYFGEGCYGLRAAAKHYFGTPVGGLTLPESAYLVGLLRSPGALTRDFQRARTRARHVLQAMVEDGRLDRDALQNVKVAEPAQTVRDELGGYYADWAASTVEVPDDGSLTPLTVHTPFDPELQRLAEKTVGEMLEKEGDRLNVGQAALVAMRPDGRVLAMVGGRDYAKSSFNRAYQAMRQPGSSFKTFVYLAALRGGIDTRRRVMDAPIRIGNWAPENYRRRYRGPVTVQQAFASSINTVAVRLSETVGREHVIQAARDLGLKGPLTRRPSLALGASELTLLELTSAFAAIAADAYPVKPWAVASLGSKTDGVARPPVESGRWDLEQGEELRGLLRATINGGTGHAARLDIPAYGKTGTSQDYRDAWFTGFAGNLVVGVWVGNDDNSPMRRVTGGNLPARMWHRFVDEARDKDPDFAPRLARVEAFRDAPRPRRQIDVAWNRLDPYAGQRAYGWGRGGAVFRDDFWSTFGPPPSRYGRSRRSRGYTSGGGSTHALRDFPDGAN